MLLIDLHRTAEKPIAVLKELVHKPCSEYKLRSATSECLKQKNHIFTKAVVLSSSAALSDVTG